MGPRNIVDILRVEIFGLTLSLGLRGGLKPLLHFYDVLDMRIGFTFNLFAEADDAVAQ